MTKIIFAATCGDRFRAARIALAFSDGRESFCECGRALITANRLLAAKLLQTHAGRPKGGDGLRPRLTRDLKMAWGAPPPACQHWGSRGQRCCVGRKTPGKRIEIQNPIFAVYVEFNRVYIAKHCPLLVNKVSVLATLLFSSVVQVKKSKISTKYCMFDSVDAKTP